MRIALLQRDIHSGEVPPAPEGVVLFASDDLAPAGAAQLGPLAVLEGDGCLGAVGLERLARDGLSVLVLHPGSESEIQAEAVLELAIDLSEKVAGLVLVVEDDGAEPGEPCHGGSAIVHAGEILAEAMSGTDLIEARVELPIARPLEHGVPVVVPVILQQRLAHHLGHYLPVDYPADV